MMIVLEGADGSGKSYAAQVLDLRLPIAVVTRFPNRTTKVGREIDRQLREGIHDPLAFQCLLTVNKYECAQALAEYVTHPASHIVVERYWQSAYVYGCLDGLYPGWLIDIHGSLPQPDLSILLDATPSLIQERRAQRGGVAEAYERAEIDQRVCELYRELWANGGEDWVVVAPGFSDESLAALVRRSLSL